MAKKNSKEVIELFKSNNFKAIIFYHIFDDESKYKLEPGRSDDTTHTVSWNQHGQSDETYYTFAECVTNFEENIWIITEIGVTNDIPEPNH